MSEKEITIKQSALDDIMKKIERLEAVQSNAKLKDFDRSIKDKSKKVVGLRVIDGKVIISWSDMIINSCEKNQAGVYKEDQKVEVTYEDEKKEKMPYVFFSRRYNLLPAEVKSETKDEDGTIFNVLTADGKKYSVRDKFTN